MKMLIVIEHLEPCLNRWLLAEYEFVAELFKNDLLVTNVRNRKHIEILSTLAPVTPKSIVEIAKNRDDVVVLDPRADKLLTKDDIVRASIVVIGGIMGDHPPKGRTWNYISSKLSTAIIRSLGPHQFTIAGAAYMLKKVIEGYDLRSIPVALGLDIELDLGREVRSYIHLPYAFPLDEKGCPVLPKNYIEIVRSYTAVYEQRRLAGHNDMCDDG